MSCHQFHTVMRNELVEAGVPKHIVETKLLHQIDGDTPRAVNQGAGTEQKDWSVPPVIVQGKVVDSPKPVAQIQKPRQNLSA